MDRRELLATAAAAGGWSGASLGMSRARPGEAPQAGLRVDGQRLNRRLEELSRFGRTPGGTNRVAYSDADRAAREWFQGLLREAGLEVRVDAGANIIGRRAGGDSSRPQLPLSPLPPLLIGSHLDSVPDGGNYDGDVGSLGALEVAQTLLDHRVSTRHPVEVVVFSNEEGGLVGSKAMVGQLAAGELAVVSNSGKTIGDGIRFLGGDPDRLEAARRGRGDVAAYLELHIEQGGTLEADGVEIGVVEGIVGIRDYEVTIEGFANHAGTTPMDRRRDAMLAAAQLTLAVNRVVTSVPGRQVGTVGRIQAFPGAPNVVPGRVVMTVEVRDLSAGTIADLSRRIVAEAERIAAATGTAIGFRLFSENHPAPTDERVRAVIRRAASQLGLSHRDQPSGAGHDAQDLARIAPVGMIFVPSVGGISHSPRELTRPRDVTNGANVLLHSLLALDAGALGG